MRIGWQLRELIIAVLIDLFLRGGANGLFDHLEYDRLIEHYRKLFGEKQVLVLPVELLKKSSDIFFHHMFDFMKIPYQTPSGRRDVNTSTQNVLILSFWRPINYAFMLLLKTLIFIFRQQNKVFPFRILQYTFFNFKTKLTKLLNKIFLQPKLDIKKYSGYLKILHRYEESNARLEKILGIDLEELGYPVHKNS